MKIMISCFVVLVLLVLLISTLSLLLLDNNSASAQQETSMGAPVTIIPAITQNILTLVSLLIGTSSFLLGLRIQSAGKTTSMEPASPSSLIPSTLQSSLRNKYFELLILALVIPALVNIIYGIFLVGSHLFPGESSYLLLLFTLFVPTIAELFLVRKLHIGTLK